MSQVRFIGEQLGGLARVFGKLRFAFKSACRLRATRQAIAVRVSTVTLDLCGCSTMLSSSAKPGSIDGSFQNTSSHDAVRVHAWARLDTDRAPVNPACACCFLMPNCFAIVTGNSIKRIPGCPEQKRHERGGLARPFGGLFFGSVGDRKGRKFVLLVIMATVARCLSD